MGGHGGLNILPQKRWNVYNFDNREKVRRDEEAAAREEQLKEEQARQRDAEFRLEKLRQASRAKRGFESHRPSDLPLPIPDGTAEPQTLTVKENKEEEADQKSDLDSKHINLFQGWNGFQMEGEEKVGKNDGDNNDKGKGRGKSIREDADDERAGNKKKKRRKEEEQSVRAVLPEDEVYRLGYGVAGKDVKTPWYLCKSFMEEEDEPRPAGERRSKAKSSPERNGEKSGKKKSLQELREERLKREQKERERTRKLLFTSSGGSRGKADVFVQNRAPYYNSGYGNAR